MKSIIALLVLGSLFTLFFVENENLLFYAKIFIALIAVAGLMKAFSKDKDASPLKPMIIPMLILAALLPFFVKNFQAYQLTEVMILAIAIMGLNLLTGINGQFSLGHSAFYAVGAYVTACLMYHLKLPFYVTLPFSMIICFGFGYGFGYPALKLEGLYLALATFALAVAMPQFLKFNLLEPLTGGAHGLQITKIAPPKILVDWLKDFNLALTPNRWLFLVTLIAFIFTHIITRNLINSQSGRAMQAIRDNPIAAESMGINVARYKTLTFGYSAMITGLAGSFSAVLVGSVYPDSFTLVVAIGFLVGMVVGGVGWLPGALFGAIFIKYVPNIAESLNLIFPSIPSNIAKSMSGIIYGVILILIIYLMPSGLGGLLKSLKDKFTKPSS